MKKLILLLCLLTSLGWGQRSKIDYNKQIKNLPVFNVTNSAYGAVCNGSTDDLAAINLAIAALNTAGRGTLAFPPLGCLIDGALTPITARVAIIGQGGQGQASRLFQKSTTSNTISITSDFSFIIKDLEIDSTVTKTAGAAIVVDGASGGTVNNGGYLENVRIVDHDVGMDVIDGSRITFEHCYFVSNETIGLKLQNTVAIDNGLVSISNSVFDNAAATQNVLWNSGGGLKVSNSKFVGADYGIDLSVVDGVTTSIFVLTGSSIEGADINAIRVRRDGTTGIFGRIVIVGNQLLVDTNQIVINFPSAGIDVGVISGNIITVAGTGKGIEIANDAVDDILITSNIFEQSSIGINVTANGAAVTIGNNMYTSVTTPWVRGTSTTILGSDGSSFDIQQTTDSVTGFQIFDADGGVPVVNVDTTNERMGVGTAAPKEILHLEASNPTARIESANASLSMVRLVESTTFLGAYVKYDGAANALQIGVHNTADSTLGNDSIGIAINRITDNVTIPSGLLIPRQLATEPESCVTAIRGAQYYDTSDEELCTCLADGTDTEWVKITDPTHTGHCSI